jgi:hypothetical protein
MPPLPHSSDDRDEQGELPLLPLELVDESRTAGKNGPSRTSQFVVVIDITITTVMKTKRLKPKLFILF